MEIIDYHVDMPLVNIVFYGKPETVNINTFSNIRACIAEGTLDANEITYETNDGFVNFCKNGTLNIRPVSTTGINPYKIHMDIMCRIFARDIKLKANEPDKHNQ